MTRSNAREIAVHLIYAARGSEIPVEELIDRRFEQTYYACLGSENEVYQEKPGNKQMSYIRSAVKGVFEHIDELDGYISRFSIGWNLNRISRQSDHGARHIRNAVCRGRSHGCCHSRGGASG